MIKKLIPYVFFAFSLFLGVLPMHAQASPSQDKLLVGTWRYEEKGGRPSVAYTIFRNDGTGKSLICTSHNGQAVWVFVAFRWKIENSVLQQTVLASNMKNIKRGSSSKDEVISIDERLYTHRDGKKVIKESRVEKLPQEFTEKLVQLESRVK